MMNSLIALLIASILGIDIARQIITGTGSWVQCLLLLPVAGVSNLIHQARNNRSPILYSFRRDWDRLGPFGLCANI